MSGNRQFESSFNDTLSALENRQIRGRVIYTDEQEPEKLKRALLLALNHVDPPTGFILVHPLHMLTAYNAFQGAGLIIGKDVSLISAFADKSFDFLTPQPSYYRQDPEAFAKKTIYPGKKRQRWFSGKERFIQPLSGIDPWQVPVPGWAKAKGVKRKTLTFVLET